MIFNEENLVRFMMQIFDMPTYTINYDHFIERECHRSIRVEKLLDLGGLLCDCAC